MAAKIYNSLHYIHQYALDDFGVSNVFGYCFCAFLNLFVRIKLSLKSFMMAYKMF